MLKRLPAVGDSIGVIIRATDSTGSDSVERRHGRIELIDDEGTRVIFGGAHAGERLTIASDAEVLPLPGGRFYFAETDEWVELTFFHEVASRRTS